MHLQSLSSTPFDTIFNAFSQAFADYDFQLSATELQNMWKRRGYDPDLSFAAFEGEEIAAFTFNGIGQYQGVQIAYDTGTGTVPAYRGRGLAGAIFTHSIPFLKSAGIDAYLLEVLQHNEKAVSVYRKAGFEVTRELNYFVWNNEQLPNERPATRGYFDITPIDVRAYDHLSGFWDFHPSWQNSFESIRRAGDIFICLGAFADQQLAGYCILEPFSGDVTQIAVDKAFRRKGIASLLLHEAVQHNKNSKTKLVNTDIGCTSITGFLQSKNIGVTGRQFEMVKKL